MIGDNTHDLLALFLHYIEILNRFICFLLSTVGCNDINEMNFADVSKMNNATYENLFFGYSSLI